MDAPPDCELRVEFVADGPVGIRLKQFWTISGFMAGMVTDQLEKPKKKSLPIFSFVTKNGETVLIPHARIMTITIKPLPTALASSSDEPRAI